MKRWGRQKPVRLDEKELKTDLWFGKFIFIGSGCDMFANDIPSEWIKKTLDRANYFVNNKYLVQTKNPAQYHKFLDDLDPERFMLCTTMETNRYYEDIMRNAPPIPERAVAMQGLPRQYKRKMITVEPILDFDLNDFSYMILCCHPVQVNVGADSGGNGLPEPGAKKFLT
jgi:DNA repair photolyase